MTQSKQPKGTLTIEEGIIQPIKGRDDPDVALDALMIMIPSELKYLVDKAQAKRVPLSGMTLNRLYQVLDLFNRPLLSLSGPFLGAPQAVMGMEKLVACGAKRIWLLGWCGSIQHHLRVGHLLIPTTAVSEEGTSCHYPVEQRPLSTDCGFNQSLEKALRRRGLNFTEGLIWTTDAPYRETPSKVKAYQAEGVLAVEMEMAALMTLAIYRRVALAGLLVVSDELFDLKWHCGFSNPLLKEVSREAADVLFEVAAIHAGERTAWSAAHLGGLGH